jgi:DinB superfamily
MDALDFFRVRYEQFHRPMWDELTTRLSERELRGRPHPKANTIVWLVWHIARVEDVGVSRFVVDGRQVMDAGDWLSRMKIRRRDVGTGMNDAEVDQCSAAIDLDGLRGYWDAVVAGTIAVVDTLRGENLDLVVPADRVKRVANEEGGVAKGAEWLTEFWAKGRTRAWILAQTPFLHAYGHYFEARAVRGMWGRPSL